ncbi:hypothetical protein BFX40_09265 [Mesorhizobium sp. SEMIA 3007]|nr:hypothetical protein BFX40_09265 [Mesorhizobium sp. SEMIA 3007]
MATDPAILEVSGTASTRRPGAGALTPKLHKLRMRGVLLHVRATSAQHSKADKAATLGIAHLMRTDPRVAT